MKITKYTHSCVRIEHEDRVLVIDPGTWSEPSALAGADAVLVTHEHGDHIDVLRLAGLGVTVYAPEGADIPDLGETRVTPGHEFFAAGFRVRAVGGRHATIYDQMPDCANLGYIVDETLYHPGDSLHVPEQPIETLLVPAHASWLKLSEAIDFARAISPGRAFAIHDAQINDRGLASVNGWFSEKIGDAYQYLPPLTTLG